jgi:hypothetical protein
LALPCRFSPPAASPWDSAAEPIHSKVICDIYTAAQILIALPLHTTLARLSHHPHSSAKKRKRLNSNEAKLPKTLSAKQEEERWLAALEAGEYVQS